MPTPFESAQLNLQLFNLRREPVLREARLWFVTEFNPNTLADAAALAGGERNAAFRMVISYWEMAASLVTTGAIDAEAFLAAHGEIVATLGQNLSDPARTASGLRRARLLQAHRAGGHNAARRPCDHAAAQRQAPRGGRGRSEQELKPFCTKNAASESAAFFGFQLPNSALPMIYFAVSGSWSGRPGSNRRHSAWEADVLPLNYSRAQDDYSGSLRVEIDQTAFPGIHSACMPLLRTRATLEAMPQNASAPLSDPERELGVSGRHRVLTRTRLLDGWSPVERVHYELTFRDGSVEVHDRDLNARGDGVTTLLFSRERGTVLLLRQPRIVATLRGDRSGETLEACSGLHESATPELSAHLEVLEETGYEPQNLTHIATVYGSPGGSLELIHLFTAEYTAARPNPGGGLRQEGEDIEVLEMPLREALALMRTGALRDARTMLLLQHLALTGLCSS